MFCLPAQGLINNLTLDQTVLSNWLIYPLDVDLAESSQWPQLSKKTTGPVFYRGTFTTGGINYDSYIKLPGWSKVL